MMNQNKRSLQYDEDNKTGKVRKLLAPIEMQRVRLLQMFSHLQVIFGSNRRETLSFEDISTSMNSLNVSDWKMDDLALIVCFCPNLTLRWEVEQTDSVCIVELMVTLSASNISRNQLKQEFIASIDSAIQQVSKNSNEFDVLLQARNDTIPPRPMMDNVLATSASQEAKRIAKLAQEKSNLKMLQRQIESKFLTDAKDTSKALLELIKSREHQSKASEALNIKTKELTEHRNRLQQLPKLAYILRSQCITEKRIYRTMKDMIIETAPYMQKSQTEMLKLLQLLANHVPEFITISTNNGFDYLPEETIRINLDTAFKSVQQKLMKLSF